jgi:GDPmannose 4,6-dehydratase
MARVAVGLQRDVALGNLDALRDWGHARDFVMAQWLMLQQDKADDYVIATGIQRSVRQFVERVTDQLGMTIEWQGQGVEEVGVLASTQLDTLKSRIGSPVVRVHPRYFRPAEVQTLLGDASKARRQLGWQPTISFDELVAEMVSCDLDRARNEVALALRGPGST